MKSKLTRHGLALCASIAALFIPAKGMAADAIFIGSAGDHNLTTGSNWFGGSPAGDWDRLIFGGIVNNAVVPVVDGTLNLDNFNGRSGITLTSGLTQDITINGPNPLIMGAVASDGFIDMSAATHNLTISTSTQYWNWSAIEWNVGAGATLFVNGGIYENAAWSLTKDGAGNAWITAAGNRTGTTAINGGALVALRSTLGTGAVTINNGGTLYVNDQWVLCGVNGFNVAEQNVASVTVNAGGQLALDAGNGYANGATNLYLNGGSVTGGNNAQPFGGLYLYNGNEQITAGGATTSTISTSLGLTGNNNTITVGAGSALNITNVLKDGAFDGGAAGGIIKAGAGTLTLSGANTYTGTTAVNSGTLEIGGAGTLGGGNYAGDITNNGALLYSSSANQTLSGFITGSGSITMSGSGTLTLTQTFNDFPAHYFNGSITVNSGTLIAPNEYFGLNPTSITVNGGILNLQTRPSELGYLALNGGTVTSDGVENASFGNIILYTDTTVPVGGAAVSTISVNQVKLRGTNSFDVGAGSTLNLTSEVGEYDGAGTLNKKGVGTLTLSGANTYSGGTTVNGGTLRFVDRAPNSSASLSIASTATLEFNVSTAPTPFDGAHVQLGAVGGTTVTGTGTFVKSGAGVLALDGQGGNHAVTFNMTGGLIHIQGGTLKNGGWNGGIWTNNKASMNIASGAMFDLWAGQSVVVNALTGAGTMDATLYGTNQTLTVGINDGSGTFSGVFQNTTGSLGLIKTGSGTQTLSGANTYTGGTTINGGTLQVTNGGALGSGNVAIGGAGALTFDTSGGSINLNGTTITGTGTMNVTGGNTLVFDAGPVNVNLSAGAQINLQSGYLESSGSFNGHWTNNQASLDVAIGAVFGLKENQVVVDALTGSGTVRQDHPLIDGNTSSLVVGIANGSGTFSGVIQDSVGAASLFKTGTGTQTLSGANTYTGTTTLNGGNTRFASTGGPAVQGPVLFTSGGFLIMDQANQFGPSSTLTFSSTPYAEFALYGHNQTIAGLSSTNPYAIVENSHSALGAATSDSTLTINQNFNSYYNGYIRDNTGNDSFKLSLVKNGSGNLQLDGGNYYYTGTTTVNNGTLQISNPAVVANTSTIIVNGGTLYFDPNNDNATIATPITLNGGQLQTYVEGAQLTFTGPVTLGGNSQIQGYAAGSTLNFTNAIGGAGNLTFLGNGGGLGHKDFMVLSGASNFVGDLYIDNYAAMAQVTLFGGDNRLPTTAVVHIGAGRWAQDGGPTPPHASALDLNGNNQMIAGLSDSGASSLAGPRSVVNTSGTPVTLTLNTPANQSFSGTIGGTDINGTTGNNLSLVKSGAATQTLSSGNNSFTGGLFVTSGTVNVNGDNNGGHTSAGNGMLSISAGATVNATGINALGYGGTAIQGTDIRGTLTLNNAITIEPTINLTGGTISNGNATGTLYTLGPINVLASATQSVISADINMKSTVTVSVASGASALFSGTVQSNPYNGGLTKSGLGTLTLSGTNTYTGATTINAGTLLIGGSASITSNTTVNDASLKVVGTLIGTATTSGNSTITVNGTLSGSTTVNTGGTLAGDNGTLGNVTVESGGAFSPGVNDGTGSLTVNGDLELKASSNFNVQFDTDGGFVDAITVNGNLTIVTGAVFNVNDIGSAPEGFLNFPNDIITYSGTWNGGTFLGMQDDSIFTSEGVTYLISYNDNDINGLGLHAVTLTIVPEPGAAVTLLGGLGLLLGVRCRRRA